MGSVDRVNENGSSGFLLEAQNITKMFGDLCANDDVTLALKPGEIHALLGENGAGKSTLVKIIYGSLQPTIGKLVWKGKPISVANPAIARALGIGMVFQHFSLFDSLTVLQNVALALPPVSSMAGLAERIERVSADYGLPLHPDVPVVDLSVGERQRIEIVRCLLQEPQLLIMDEPTAVLTPQEADRLFVTLERLAIEGCAILYISHRLEEVKRICNDATILRHGKLIAKVDPKQETASSLANLMVGSEVGAVQVEKQNGGGMPMLELRELSMPTDDPFGVTLKEIDLSIESGEIVAIAGVAGNGQSELFDAISGETTCPSADMVRLAEVPCGSKSITARRRHNVAFVPEQRIGHGAISNFTLSENVILTHHAVDSGLVRHGLINHAAAKDLKERITKSFDVRKDKPDPNAHSLSGGNLQKFVVGREIVRDPNILVVNQPTWGVDAGAARMIRQSLIDMARSGAAVLVISQDLDEIFEIADCIAVISRGELSRAYPTAEMTPERIGLLMAGAYEQAATSTATNS